MIRMLSGLALVVITLFLVGPQSFAEEPTGDDYLAYHKPLLGTWKVTIQEGEKVYSGTATWELGAKGKCFVVQLEAEGLPALQALIAVIAGCVYYRRPVGYSDQLLPA